MVPAGKKAPSTVSITFCGHPYVGVLRLDANEARRTLELAVTAKPAGDLAGRDCQFDAISLRNE
jgi:hypothetical protein